MSQVIIRRHSDDRPVQLQSTALDTWLPGAGASEVAWAFALGAGASSALLAGLMYAATNQVWLRPVVGVAVVAGAGLALWRLTLPERQEHRWAAQLDWRRWLMEELTLAEAPAAEPEEELDAAALAARVDELAREMIHRHYAGLGAERERMEEAGRCSQQEWNAVNALLVSAGIRERRRWLAESEELALRLWQVKRSGNRFVTVDLGYGEGLLRWG